MAILDGTAEKRATTLPLFTTMYLQMLELPMIKPKELQYRIKRGPEEPTETFVRMTYIERWKWEKTVDGVLLNQAVRTFASWSSLVLAAGVYAAVM